MGAPAGCRLKLPLLGEHEELPPDVAECRIVLPVVLRRQGIPLVARVFVPARRASVDARVRRRCARHEDIVECSVLALTEQVSVFVESHRCRYSVAVVEVLTELDWQARLGWSFPAI